MLASSSAPAPELAGDRSCKDAWCRRMRQEFSPAAILTPCGDINQAVFQPDQVLQVSERKWTPDTLALLQQGLQAHGVGAWDAIAADFLPGWDTAMMQQQCLRFLGTNDLGRYMRWRPSKADMKREKDRNKQLGTSLGCWQSGMLVENTAGDVAKALAALEKVTAGDANAL